MTTISHALPELDPMLYKNERGAKVKKHPRCGVQNGHGGKKVPDATVLEIRVRFEQQCWSMRKLMAHYPYSQTYIRNVVEYIVRPHLKPSAK